MSVEEAMQAGRQLALTLLVDEGTLTRPGEGGTIDPVTGDWTPASAATVYDGPCRVRKPDGIAQQVVFGDVNTTVERFLVDLPVDVALLNVGDVFTATLSADPELVGRSMRVVAIVAKSVLMYRQAGLEAVE